MKSMWQRPTWYRRLTSSTTTVDALKAPKKQLFAISKLASDVSPKEAVQVEQILASLDGALHLHYAKFGASLQALYSSFEPAATKSTTVSSIDADFPAGFCPTEDSNDDNHNGNGNGNSNPSTQSSRTHNDHDRDTIDIEMDNNTKKRHQAYRMSSCFVWLARRAAFDPITLEDQKQAENNHFLMTTPVRVLWDYFDERALHLNNTTHYDQFEHIDSPTFAKRLLLLKRGRGVTQTKGYYLGEKIDELTNRISQSAMTKTKHAMRNAWEVFKNSTTIHNSAGEWKAVASPETTATTAATTAATTTTTTTNKRKQVQETDIASFQSSSVWSKINVYSMRTLFSQVTLKEPAYDDVLMLQSPAQWREEDQSNQWRHLIFGQDQTRKPNYDLHLSHFRKVPRSDLELILPADALVVKLRPSLLLNYALVGVGAVVLTGSLVWHGMEISVAGAIASSGLVVYLTRAGFKYYMSKLYYKSSVTQYLSSNCIATNRASIHSILHEARQQDFRCIAIVCCALWGEGNVAVADDNVPQKMVKAGVGSTAVTFGELLGKCHHLVHLYEMNKKVTIDEERISNALHWLSINNIIVYDESHQSIKVRSIASVHQQKDAMIQRACDDHDHMWRSLNILTK